MALCQVGHPLLRNVYRHILFDVMTKAEKSGQSGGAPIRQIIRPLKISAVGVEPGRPFRLKTGDERAALPESSPLKTPKNRVGSGPVRVHSQSARARKWRFYTEFVLVYGNPLSGRKEAVQLHR